MFVAKFWSTNLQNGVRQPSSGELLPVIRLAERLESLGLKQDFSLATSYLELLRFQSKVREIAWEVATVAYRSNTVVRHRSAHKDSGQKNSYGTQAGSFSLN